MELKAQILFRLEQWTEERLTLEQWDRILIELIFS